MSFAAAINRGPTLPAHFTPDRGFCETIRIAIYIKYCYHANIISGDTNNMQYGMLDRCSMDSVMVF